MTECLTLTHSLIDLNTLVAFKLEVVFLAITQNKEIRIKVYRCLVANCRVCKSYDHTACFQWNNGFDLSNNEKSCTEKVPEVQNTTATNTTTATTAQTAAQSAVGASVMVGSMSSVLSGSSPQGMWSSVNQFQLYLLVPLVGAFIHQRIHDFLKGFEFASLSLDFIDFKSLFGIREITKHFDFLEPDDYLNSVGLEYQSSVMNSLQLIFLIGFLILLHLWVIVPMHKYSQKYSEEKFFRKIMDKLFYFFTFSLYIRLVLEAYQLFALSALHEIYIAKLDGAFRIVSFAFSIALIMFWAGFYVAVIIICLKKLEQSPELQKSYFAELVKGIKMNKFSKLYFWVFMSRRLLGVVVVVLWQSLPILVKVSLFLSIQVSTFWFIIVRPFQSIKDNLLEFLNELTYWFFTGSLLFYNTEADWSDSVAKVIVNVLLANILIATAIQLIFIGISLFKFLKSKWFKNIPQRRIKPEEVRNIDITQSVDVTQINQTISHIQSISKRDGIAKMHKGTYISIFSLTICS